jgi:hypothetical protein
LKAKGRAIDVIVREHRRCIQWILQQWAGSDGRTDSIVRFRLQLIFGLARAEIIARPRAEYSLAISRERRPGETEARAEILG